MKIHLVACAALALGLLAAYPAAADLPSPVGTALFAFPGSPDQPGSAASAGLAMTDRWLGDEPFWNPALRARSTVRLSPLLLRLSRQDLRKDNRSFDEQPVAFDAAGLWLSFPLAPVTIGVYGYQPLLRVEDNAFQRGVPGGPSPPAVLQSNSSMRELRGGVSISVDGGRARSGIGVEWTHRTDRYELNEQSGAPDEGLRTAEFSGGGIGLQAGAALDLGGRRDDGEGTFSLGAAVRYVPELTLEGEERAELTLAGTSSTPISVNREAGFEAGASLRWNVSPALALGAGGGARTAQEWKEFAVSSGEHQSFGGSLRYHDERDPWTVFFGIGQEQQSGVPEPRAGLVGLGIGWKLEGMTLDFGLLHRSLQRAGKPNSADDRVVVTVGF